MPKYYKIKVDSHFCLSADESSRTQTIVALAKVENFPCDLPLAPNLREPNPKSTVFRKILDSLFLEPGHFGERNGGIVLSAASVNKLSQHELVLEILDPSEGVDHYGVLNGGHTILAFKKAKEFNYDVTSAKVKLTIHVGLNEKAARQIGLATNTSSPVDARSIMNARGEYEFIKAFLTKVAREENTTFRIAYYQNQSDAPRNPHCSIKHVYKLIRSLDCVRYNPNNKAARGRHPSTKNVPSEFSEAEAQKLKKMLHLLPQAFWIEAQVYATIEKYLSNPRQKGNNPLAGVNLSRNTLLPDRRYSFGFSAPGDLALPIVSAFRVFLDTEYQWVIPFDEFAIDLVEHLWKTHFLDFLKTEKKNGNPLGERIERCKELWQSLYVSAAMLLNSMYHRQRTQHQNLKSATPKTSEASKTTKKKQHKQLQLK